MSDDYTTQAEEEHRDAIVKEMEERTVAYVRRANLIRGLRELADFLESHPGVKMPVCSTMNAFVDTREELAAHALVATWDKTYMDSWFALRKTFGDDLTLEVNAPREVVCRKVVTGTRIIEAQPEREVEEFVWECTDPVLRAR